MIRIWRWISNVIINCAQCKEDFIKKSNRKNETGKFFCCRACIMEYKFNEKMNKLKNELNLKEDVKDFLYTKYHTERLSTREISVLLFNKETSASTIQQWLKRFDIPIRTGSDAIKTQWENNPQRKERQSEMFRNSDRTNLYKIMQTKEYKNKISVANSGSKNGMYGKTRENHPNWNVNITEEERIIKRKTFKDKHWRNLVFERDSYTCKCCGDDKGGNLNAHHLDGYHWAVKDRHNIENGITLCEDCHINFHKIYGYKNNTKEQFGLFIKELNLSKN